MNLAEKEEAVHTVAKLAKRYHEGQTRQDKMTPYITHPIEVMALLRADGFDWEMQCAALLHDVIEDCDFADPKSLMLVLKDIMPLESATRIVTMVVGMTSPDKQYTITGMFSRSDRKAMMRAHLEVCGWQVIVIKTYDRYCNIKDMEGFSDSFKNTYAEESLLLGRLLQKRIERSEMDPKELDKAWDKASDIINISKKLLGR